MGTPVDTLITRFEADLSKWEADMKKMSKLANDNIDSVVKHHGQQADALHSIWGRPGQALEKVFDESRLKVLDSGVARIGLFGSALESLGPVGIGAAAAIGAVGLAFEQAKSAAEFADRIEDTSKKIGITTTQLQELDFMALKTGTSVELFHNAIREGNAVLGAYDSNLKDGRIKSFFSSLGISKDTARQYQNIYDMLPLILDKLKQIGSLPEQTQFLKKFGMEDLLPLVQGGADGFKEMQRQAHALGLVIDENMIKKGAEANKQFEIASKTISTQLHQAFLDLAPVLDILIAKVADMVTWTVRLVEALRSVENRSTATLQHEYDGQTKRMGDDLSYIRRFDPKAEIGPDDHIKFSMPWYRVPLNAAAKAADFNTRADHVNPVIDELHQREADTPPPPPPPAHALGAEKGKKGPPDQTADFDKSARDALDSASKELADAFAKLSDTIEERAKFEQQSLDAAHDKKITDLDAQAAKIAASKNDANKADQLALIERAKRDTDGVYLAQSELLARRTLVELLTRQEQLREQTVSLETAQMTALEQQYTAQAGLANTVQERNAFEAKALAERQKREDLLAQDQIKRAQAALSAGLTNHNQHDIDTALGDLAAATQNYNQLAQTRAQENAAQAKSHQGPVANYLDSLKDIKTEIQNIEVQGLQGLTDGITQAIEGTKSLGAAFHDVANQIISDLLRIAVQKAITAPLANALFGTTGVAALFGIPGFASGTDFAPGGTAVVGENGPELVNLPRGSQVLPNSVLRNAVGAVSGGGAGMVYAPTFQISANNGLVVSELQQHILAVSTHAAAQAYDLARKTIPVQMAKQGGRQLPR